MGQGFPAHWDKGTRDPGLVIPFVGPGWEVTMEGPLRHLGQAGLRQKGQAG